MSYKKNIYKEFVEFVSLRNTLNITYLFQFAYGVTNLDNICDFILDLANDGLLLDEHCKFNFMPIMNPIEQSVMAVPPQLFDKFKVDSYKLLLQLKDLGYTNHFTIPLFKEINDIRSYIESNPFEKTHLNDFYKNQIILDEIRGEDIFKILPDYRKLLTTNDGKSLI